MNLQAPPVHQEPAYKFQIWKIFLFFIRSCTDHKLNVNVSINSESNIRFKRTASCFSKPAAKHMFVVTYWDSNWLFTFKSKEKVTPCWSWNLVFSSMEPCLFSSQVPLAFFSDGNLKLVEVHQEFLKQEWLQEVRLGDSKLLTTCPFNCLSCRVVKDTDRKSLESSSAA